MGAPKPAGETRVVRLALARMRIEDRARGNQDQCEAMTEEELFQGYPPAVQKILDRFDGEVIDILRSES